MKNKQIALIRKNVVVEYNTDINSGLCFMKGYFMV